MDAAEKEFSQTESFIKAAESFLPEYKWGRYDLLLLPPSFPYGFMKPHLKQLTATRWNGKPTTHICYTNVISWG